MNFCGHLKINNNDKNGRTKNKTKNEIKNKD